MMARRNQRKIHAVHCKLSASLVQRLDHILNHDERWYNRTHLIEQALTDYVVDWEEKNPQYELEYDATREEED